MIVTYVYSHDCQTCALLDALDVPAAIADVLAPLADVHWDPHPISRIGSVNPFDEEVPVPLTSENGVSFVNQNDPPIDDLRDRSADLYTPQLVVDTQQGDTITIDPVELVDQQVKRERELLLRQVLKRVWSIYLDTLDLSPRDKLVLKQQRSQNQPRNIQPRYEPETFKPDEWRNAFVSARQATY